MAYKFHMRAFHPDEGFGMGGFGFEGDNRGFSFLPRGRVTSRIGATSNIDTSGQRIENPVAYSDPSTSPWGIHEDYSAPSKAPEAWLIKRSISPHVEDGMQNVDFLIHNRGQNHAFRVTEDGRGAHIPIPFTDKRLDFVPYLDIRVHFSMRVDLHRKLIHIESTLTGDGFPNSEVFIRDHADTPIMLNTHHRIGHAAGQLIGNHNHLLASSEFTIECDGSGNFTGPIEAIRSVDFMPFDRDLVAIAGTTNFSIPSWNNLHLARQATEKGFLGLDTDDDLPIPYWDHEYPRDGDWGIDDLFDEPKAEDLPDWNH